MSLTSIWIGGLPIGREWTFDHLISIFSKLGEYSSTRFIFDVSDIYAEGSALPTLSKALHALRPSNVYVSLKLGFERAPAKSFSIMPISYQPSQLLDQFTYFYSLFPSRTISSFQLHCLPSTSDSYEHVLNDLSLIQNSYPFLEFGVCNVEKSEYTLFASRLMKPLSLIQLQGNILEQRLLLEFLSSFPYTNIIVNRALCRGYLRDTPFHDYHSRPNRTATILNQSTSLRDNFLCNLLASLVLLDIPISIAALHWLLSHSRFVHPIIGSREISQLFTTIDALIKPDKNIQLAISSINSLLNQYPTLNTHQLPLKALE